MSLTKWEKGSPWVRLDRRSKEIFLKFKAIYTIIPSPTFLEGDISYLYIWTTHLCWAKIWPSSSPSSLQYLKEGLSFHLLEWSISLSRNHFCSPPSFWGNLLSISILMMCGCKQPSHNTLPTCQHPMDYNQCCEGFGLHGLHGLHGCMYVCMYVRIELTILWVLGKEHLWWLV
jgi:hypothetical protein